MSTVPNSDSSGGATPGGKACCSRSRHQAFQRTLAAAAFADEPLRAGSLKGLVGTVTFVRCAVITACSQCGSVLSAEIDLADL